MIEKTLHKKRLSMFDNYSNTLQLPCPLVNAQDLNRYFKLTQSTRKAIPGILRNMTSTNSFSIPRYYSFHLRLKELVCSLAWMMCCLRILYTNLSPLLKTKKYSKLSQYRTAYSKQMHARCNPSTKLCFHQP